MTKAHLATLTLALIVIFSSGCSKNVTKTKSNPDSSPKFSTSSYVQNSSTLSSSVSSKQPSFDFSKYSAHGAFHEGLAWVKTSSYDKGEAIGYIDESGNMQIPLNEAWKSAGDFYMGKAPIQIYDGYTPYWLFIDKQGNALTKFRRTTQVSANIYAQDFLQYDNGIVEYKDNNDHYFLLANGTVKKIPFSWPQGYNGYDATGSWSEGLLGFHHSGLANDKFAYYLNEQGDIAIDVYKANSAIVSVVKTSDFKNNQATIVFTGKNNKYYQVNIGKDGKFIGEPVETDFDINSN